MKSLMKSINLIVAVTMVALLLMLAVPTGAVLADTPDPNQPQATAEAGRGVKLVLERMFRRQAYRITLEQVRFQRAADVAARVQARIDRMKQEGKDTTAIEAALATFKSQVEAARAEYNQGVAIHTARAGFDKNGKVTDLEQAKTTVKNTSDHLVASRRMLDDAFRELFWTIIDLRITQLDSLVTE